MKATELQTGPMNHLTIKADPEILQVIIDLWNEANIEQDGYRLTMDIVQYGDPRYGEASLTVTRHLDEPRTIDDILGEDPAEAGQLEGDAQ